MRRRALIPLFLFLASTSARATGPCEDTAYSASATAYSPTKHQIVIEGEQGWCEVSEPDEEEVTGSQKFAFVVDGASGKVTLEFREAKTGPPGSDAAFEVDGGPKRLSTLTAYQKTHAFQPLRKFARSPAGKCRISGRTAKLYKPACRQEIVVRRKGARAAYIALQDCADAEAENARTYKQRPKVSVTPIWLADRRQLLTVASIERCTGGPPPGYFGEDDAGECYTEQTRVVRVFDATTTPELEHCFAKIKPPPTLPQKPQKTP